MIVVKVEFDPIERAWRDGQALSFVTDANGVLLLSSDASLRFRALHAIAPARKAQITAALQFGGAPLTPLGITIADDGLTTMRDGAQAMTASLPVPVSGWRLYHIEPMDAALKAARQRAEVAAILFAVLLSLLVAALVWALARRRRASAARAAAGAGGGAAYRRSRPRDGGARHRRPPVPSGARGNSRMPIGWARSVRFRRVSRMRSTSRSRRSAPSPKMPPPFWIVPSPIVPRPTCARSSR
ncbi:hypothetical protein AWL63_22845 [Sphingomonas panacis]|uniref:Uncharacterized protein n=1 Tax=Sphingomonas panacis TaxID=1560345 RepID=A0A1B3ZG16_9SPHN|nr:hypothetical protein AWL63_22845 [Sphingomonas panacis]